MNKIKYLLVFVVLISSCASFNYRNSKQKKENNTFILHTNVADVQVRMVNTGDVIGNTTKRDNSLTYSFESLKRKYCFFELSKENYETKIIKIRRAPRVQPIVIDVLLSPISYALPIIIDPFRPDFYKIAKSSKNRTVNLDFSQEFMMREFYNISGDNNPQTFQSYIDTYPYSDYVQAAVTKRDSLSLSIAIKSESKDSIDIFINTHKESEFIADAKKAIANLSKIKQAYNDAIKKDSVEVYDRFIDDYPNTKYTKIIVEKLLDVAYRNVISENSSKETFDYIQSYLVLHEGDIEPRMFEKRFNDAIELLQNQIIAESNVFSNNYDKNSDKWKKYQQYKSSCLKIKTLPKIESVKKDICNELLLLLQSTNDAANQNKLFQKVSKDFPNLSLNNDIVKTILDGSINKNGKIQLHNPAYLIGLLNSISISNSYALRYFLDNLSELKEHYSSDSFTIDLSYSHGSLQSVSVFSPNEKKIGIAFENDRKPIEFAYYNNGMVVSKYFVNNGCDYIFEFDGKTNKTLSAINEIVSKGELLLKEKKYVDAVTYYTNEEKANTNYLSCIPRNIPEVDKFFKSRDKAIELNNEESKRIEKFNLEKTKRAQEAENLSNCLNGKQSVINYLKNKVFYYISPSNPKWIIFHIFDKNSSLTHASRYSDFYSNPLDVYSYGEFISDGSKDVVISYSINGSNRIHIKLKDMDFYLYIDAKNNKLISCDKNGKIKGEKGDLNLFLLMNNATPISKKPCSISTDMKTYSGQNNVLSRYFGDSWEKTKKEANSISHESVYFYDDASVRNYLVNNYFVGSGTVNGCAFDFTDIWGGCFDFINTHGVRIKVIEPRITTYGNYAEITACMTIDPNSRITLVIYNGKIIWDSPDGNNATFYLKK